MTSPELAGLVGKRFSIAHPGLRTRTGEGVTIAVIDSGVHARHPHVGGVTGGIGVQADGTILADHTDRIGHGTAVTAAIKERVPGVRLFVVKVFDTALSTTTRALVRGLQWALEQDVDLINLSLGTAKTERASHFAAVMDAVRESGVWLISATAHDGQSWLPGSMTGAVGVMVDWACDRDSLRVQLTEDGVPAFAASGYPRPIPGVPPERNLRGVSFAVANTTALLARVRQGLARNTTLESALVPFALPDYRMWPPMNRR